MTKFFSPTIFRLSEDKAPEANRFAESLRSATGLGKIPVRSTVSLRCTEITITRLSAASYTRRLTGRIAVEKAFVVTVPLQPLASLEVWRSGRLCSASYCPTYGVSMSHLEEEPQWGLPERFDLLMLHIPELALIELSSSGEIPTFGKFWTEGSIHDEVIGGMAYAAAAAMKEGVEDPLLFDHLLLAMCARLMEGQVDGEPMGRTSYGLSVRQERRAKELLTADLSAGATINDVATAVGVSVSRFSTAFKSSTGLPPHRWLRQYRVETAKGLMARSGLSLAEIAYACGFADQSHFTRVFNSSTGMSPGCWRRAMG